MTSIKTAIEAAQDMLGDHSRTINTRAIQHALDTAAEQQAACSYSARLWSPLPGNYRNTRAAAAKQERQA